MRKRLEQKVAAINATMPMQTRRRVVNGEIQHYEVRKVAISNGAMTTGLLIVGFYKTAYDRTREALGSLATRIPPLNTNSENLAQLRQISSRSIRTHIGILLKHGLLSEKQFHGSERNYDLWISEEIMYGSSHEAILQSPSFSATYNGKWKEFPHTPSLNKNQETETGGNALWKSQNQNNQLNKRRKVEAPCSSNATTVLPQNHTGGGGGQAQKSVLDALPDTFRNFVFTFWLHAWRILYKERNYTPQQHEMAISAILRGVYRGFDADLSEKEWLTYYEQCFVRLDKAAKYYERYPEQRPPDPYAVHEAGKGYFDAENKYGFGVTEAWLDKDLRDKAKRLVENRLKACFKDFERLIRKEKPRKEVAGKSADELYKFWHDHFRVNFGKNPLQRFEQQFQSRIANRLHKPKVTPPSYFTSRMTVEDYKNMIDAQQVSQARP